MLDLGTLRPGGYSVANDTSGDGSVVVGYAESQPGDRHAFRWEGGVMTDIGTLNGGRNSFATGVSSDGTVVAGTSVDGSAGNSNRAFRWTASNGMTSLGSLSGLGSTANAVSADGEVIVGYDNVAGGSWTAVRWQDGVMQDLGRLPGDSYSEAYAVSGDGSVVVGYSQNQLGTTRAFRWSQDTGMQSIHDWLTDNGLEAPITLNSVARGVSADGETVLANLQFTGSQYEPYLVRAKQPRKIVLAFGQDAFVSLSVMTSPNGDEITYADPTGTQAAYREESPEFDEFKQYVRQEVENIYRAQFIDGLAVEDLEVVIGGIEPGASNIFFINKDIVPPTSLLGQAYTGVDQFNNNLGGEAFVLLGSNDVRDFEKQKLIAETTAHEAGHLMGLVHIDPPGDQSVMDYDVPPVDQGEYFINDVYPREEPPGSGDQIAGVTHNPFYHLMRYVEGHSNEELVAAGINPGTWDLTPSPPLEIGLNFELAGSVTGVSDATEAFASGSDALPTALYDVLLLEATADPDQAVLLAAFEEIQLDDLSAKSFVLDGGSALRFFASLTPGGERDVALAVGDLFAPKSTVLYPGFGDSEALLQLKTGEDTFVTLASVALRIQSVPEPSSVVLLAWISCAMTLQIRCGRRARKGIWAARSKNILCQTLGR